MLFYSNFVCYNQVFTPKSGLLSQKMPNAALIKSAVVFASIRYLQRKKPIIAKSYISFFVFIRWYINSSELLYQNIPLRLQLIACKTCKWLGPNLLLIQCITTESYKSRNKEGSYSAVSGYALITLHPFPECMSLSLQCFIGSDIFITNCK